MGLWLLSTGILVLRLRGLMHFVHHHSFRAINLAPLRWLAKLGEAQSRHVFLSETMQAHYRDAYLIAAQCRAVLAVLKNSVHL
ncbi:MAG: hypothetical protein AB8B71_09055 [Paracoccaceae bacterium]